jgi:hypothetical protein
MKYGNEYKDGASSLLCVHLIDIFADILKCQPQACFAIFPSGEFLSS